ncbi:hypothetical protein PI125_g25192 [Phytophthora idaei]|nr:hypothetical protein PI125_g25192 [Phytophthora idaei]
MQTMYLLAAQAASPFPVTRTSVESAAKASSGTTVVTLRRRTQKQQLQQ